MLVNLPKIEIRGFGVSVHFFCFFSICDFFSMFKAGFMGGGEDLMILILILILMEILIVPIGKEKNSQNILKIAFS